MILPNHLRLLKDPFKRAALFCFQLLIECHLPHYKPIHQWTCDPLLLSPPLSVSLSFPLIFFLLLSLFSHVFDIVSNFITACCERYHFMWALNYSRLKEWRRTAVHNKKERIENLLATKWLNYTRRMFLYIIDVSKVN